MANVPDLPPPGTEDGSSQAPAAKKPRKMTETAPTDSRKSRSKAPTGHSGAQAHGDADEQGPVEKGTAGDGRHGEKDLNSDKDGVDKAEVEEVGNITAVEELLHAGPGAEAEAEDYDDL